MNNSLKQLLLGLYKMALCDNNFAPEEANLLYQVGKEYDVSDDEVNAILLDDTFTLYVPETLEGKVKLLYRFTEMAWADGKIVDNERLLLKQTAVRYGFLPENSDTITDFFIEQVKQCTPIEKVIESIMQK